ncbi:gated mechanosensitive channel [Mycena metata]|uniref:Gated mechanosensitive channel n=1 Tax=Mycena metata TaxID=1033252 RepID=A0AAD7KCA7_9AGAR|nr:gated mechanosensitive channel [Mycena metata]
MWYFNSARMRLLGFLGRDNVLEAGGFSTLINSLVSDVLLPPISLLPFLGRNLPAKFLVLRAGPNHPYNTLQQAAEDGAVTLAWGAFVDNLVTFFALGAVLYGIAEIYSALTKENIIKHIIKCKYCRKDISQTATRCAFCTSWLDGREDKQVPSSSALI